ncbi:MAG: tetratricopeptide repeat protein [Symploca sp. SIO1B1]|nr:tetratricopeptide repeat protein [Symploca sp. SIO1B1]
MEANYDLIKRLKAIKPLLEDSHSNLIERYAGISELALFKDAQKIGLLTVGLFDTNTQVRELAAEVLKKTYGLGKSSSAVLTLLANEREGLKKVVYYREEELFSDLLASLKPLLRKNGHYQDEKFVDCYRKHVLTILDKLECELRQLENEEVGTHPLKQLLEEENNRWILEPLQECLGSKDVFCRRNAILVVGELGLEFDLAQSSFELIREVIDSPENRHDYLVTWDGIKALTALAQQNSNELGLFYRVIRSFFNTRTYKLDEPEKGEEHRFYTLQHCVEALGTLIGSEKSQVLIEKLKELRTDGEKRNLLHLMSFDGKPKREIVNACGGAKRAFINVFSRIYKYEYESNCGNNQLTESQREILDLIGALVSSQDSSVRATAIGFFGNLPDARQALDYLLENAHTNNASVGDNSSQGRLENLFAERQEIITVIGTIIIRASQRQPNLIEEKSSEVSQLLREWCFPIKDSNEQERNARLLALWRLYNLSADYAVIPSLPETDIQNLLSLEEDASFRSVLELFRARNSGELFQNQLLEITKSNDHELVRACAKIELLIQAKEKNELSDEEDLEEQAVNYIQSKIRQIKVGQLTDIPYSLAERFMPVLAVMNQPNAHKLIKNLLTNQQFIKTELGLQLRERLSSYHCYELRQDIIRLLLQELKQKYKKNELLRLYYANLLRAGEYRKQNDKSDELLLLEHKESSDEQEEQALKNRVLKELQSIASNFETVELPVLFNEKRVVALDSLSPKTVNTVLYTTDNKDTEESIVNLYLRSSPQFPGFVFCFLDRAIADTEVATEIDGFARLRSKAVSQKLSQKQRRYNFNKISPNIVGRVEAIAEDGVIIDVGLCRYKPFVSFEAMSWRNKDNPSELWGVLRLFQVLSITFDTSNGQDEIVELKLSQSPKDVPIDSPEGTKGETVQAQIVRLSDKDESQQGVVFCLEEQNEQELFVPLRELSSQSDSDWIKGGGWRSEFKNRIAQTLEITYNGQDWSLRANAPKEEYFVQLLYQKGIEDFKLIYSEKTDNGYVFEIEPGKRAFIPAERLVKNELEFLLPDKKISSGDLFTVRFAANEINGQKEVVLNVLDWVENEWGENEQREKRLHPGMRIVGRLSAVNEEKRTGTVIPLSDKYPQIKSCSVIIRNLPVDDPAAGITQGSLVSGKIKDTNVKCQQITLDYDAVAMPSQIELGESYLCIVENNPKSEDYSLKLSYGKVSGELTESSMTYRHTPVLFDDVENQPKYSKGERLMARLARPIKWNRRYVTATIKQPEKTLASLGLEHRQSTSGHVVSFSKGIIEIERSDRQRFQLLLDELKLKSELPFINIGDRFELSRTSEHKIEITVHQSSRPKFTILPDLDQRKEWRKWKTLLKPGEQYKCVYIDWDRRSRSYLLELKPGTIFALPLSSVSSVENATPWLLNEEIQWRLTNQGTVEILLQGESESNTNTYKLHTGDFLTLSRRESDGVLQLHKFKPSPLHLAAEPQNFAGEPWSFGVSQDEQQIPITAKVTNIRSREGIYPVELVSVLSPDEEIPLRSGIIGFYSRNQMSVEDRERFYAGEFRRDDQVRVILCHPPEINNKGQLKLTLKSDQYSEDASETIIEKLRKLEEEIRTNSSQPKEGTIVRYDRKRRAFLVTLQELSQCRCWLPEDEVSFSLVRTYQSLKAFGEKLDKYFTVLRVVNIDELELEVSLKNNPRGDIDDAGSVFDWSDGDILRGATFIGVTNKTESHSLESSSVSQPDNSLEDNQTGERKKGWGNNSADAGTRGRGDAENGNPTQNFAHPNQTKSAATPEETVGEGTNTPSLEAESPLQTENSPVENPTESAADTEENFADGTEPSSETTSLLPESDNSQEETRTESAANTEAIVGVEIEPGEIIELPTERFLVYGTPYHSGSENQWLQPGDQITLRVVEDNNSYSFDVVRRLQAEINRLSDERRVVYGKAEPMDTQVGIKIQGYEKVYEKYRCLLAPEFHQKLEELGNPDLFRFKLRQHQELYFEPISLTELKRDDLLRVTYKENVNNGIRVTFGNNRQGYIHQSQISYRSEFTLSEFCPESGTSFNARIDREVTDSGDVKFSFKKVPPQGFDYFLNLDSYMQKKLLKEGVNTILVRQGKQKDYLDIEVEPGAVVRVYYQKIEIAPQLNKDKPKLKHELTPGDELRFKLIKQQNKAYLQLVDLVKSLSSYLEKGMIVLARYKERNHYGQWIFSLPEYAPREGNLRGNLPNVFDAEERRLVVEHIPDDLTWPVRLRLPETEHREFVLRIENISGDRIQVQNQDGQNDFLYSANATYRINNRITYLQEQLGIGKVIVATHKSGQLSLRDNKPIVFTLLRRYFKSGHNSSQDLELTYVRSEGDDRIFEIKPGQLICIPAAKLYFYDLPFRDFQRFLPGDFFTVSIEYSDEERQEEFRVVIRKISLSILHDLQPNQLIKAQVKTILPEGRGIIIRAKHLKLEQFLKSRQLLKQSTNYFQEGDEIWLEVQKIRHAQQFIDLSEVDSPSLDVLKTDSGTAQKKVKSLLLYGNISQKLREQLQLNVLGKSLKVWLSNLAWFNIDEKNTVDEVLPSEEQGMWISVFTNKNGELRANPKELRSFKVNKQLEKGQIVQAQVLQLNQDQQGNPKNVLLDVDGVRTLIANTDVARGVPSNLPSIERGTWLAVHILDAESNPYDAKNQRFLVSSLAVSSALDNLSKGKCFQATVRYTLPHGLVFSYEGALGYVSNEQLAWSRNAKALEMFKPGEQILVYKVADCEQRRPFSLKHESQIEDLKLGDEVEAIIHRKTDTGVYVRANSLWTFVPRHQLNSEQWTALSETDKIVLRLEDIALQQMKVLFYPVREGGDLHDETPASLKEIRETLELHYMTSVSRFQPLLQKRNPHIVNLLAQHYLDVGNNYRKQGDKQKALVAYQQALEIHPNYSLAWYNQGEIQRELAKNKEALEKAINFYTEGINADEGWDKVSLARAYYSRGCTHFPLGHNQAVIEDCNQAIAQKLDYADVYHLRGVAYLRLKNPQTAIKDFNQALEKNPEYAKAYYQRGMAHLQVGNFQAAINDLQQAVQRNIQYATVYYNLGMARSQLSDNQAAIEDFNQAITKNLNYAEAYCGRGMARFQLGEHQVAIKDFNQAIGKKLNYAEAYYGRGMARFQLSEHQAAIEDFNQTINIKSDYEQAYYHRGLAHSQLGDNQAAIEDFDQAINIKSDYEQAYYRRGMARLQLGDNRAAIEDFDKTIKLNSDYAEAYECRGDAHSQLSNPKAALTDFYKALELFTQQQKINDCQRVLNKIKALNQ